MPLASTARASPAGDRLAPSIVGGPRAMAAEAVVERRWRPRRPRHRLEAQPGAAMHPRLVSRRCVAKRRSTLPVSLRGCRNGQGERGEARRVAPRTARATVDLQPLRLEIRPVSAQSAGDPADHRCSRPAAAHERCSGRGSRPMPLAVAHPSRCRASRSRLRPASPRPVARRPGRRRIGPCSRRARESKVGRPRSRYRSALSPDARSARSRSAGLTGLRAASPASTAVARQERCRQRAGVARPSAHRGFTRSGCCGDNAAGSTDDIGLPPRSRRSAWRPPPTAVNRAANTVGHPDFFSSLPERFPIRQSNSPCF